MHLDHRLVFISSLLVSVCISGFIIKTSDPDDSGIVESTVNILESCYGDRLTSLGVAGNLTGRISKSLWSRGNVTVTLIDDSTRHVNSGPVRPISQHKLQFFVVSSSSSTALTRTLRQIKASIWWNHMATFLILDWGLSSEGCSSAFEMLWAAWEMNILIANLLCYRPAKGRLIYTYNPYTTQAPSTWQVDKTYSGKNDHPWTLFVRGYVDGESVCNDLDFEKTNDLGGYEIRGLVSNITVLPGAIKSDRVCVGEMEQMLCDFIYPTLNATPKILMSNIPDNIGYVDDEGNARGCMAMVANGSIDISFMPWFIRFFKSITMTYPDSQSSLGILTQHRGYKSQLSKILSVLDTNSRIGLCLVCLINILLLKYFLRRPLMVGYLNTLLIICNSAIRNIPRNLATRIYLGSLFLFALTMQGIYQGQFASLLTNQVALRNPNTMKDLTDLGYTIYGHNSYAILFNDPELQGRFVGIDTWTCTNYVLRDPKAACVDDYTFLVNDAVKFKLYLSKNALLSFSVAHQIRPDWPLERRINAIMSRISESYCSQHLMDRLIEKWNLDVERNEYNEHGFKIIKLGELIFAFVILGIGLLCATVCFVIEGGMGHSRNKVAINLVIRRRNRS